MQTINGGFDAGPGEKVADCGFVPKHVPPPDHNIEPRVIEGSFDPDRKGSPLVSVEGSFVDQTDGRGVQAFAPPSSIGAGAHVTSRGYGTNGNDPEPKTTTNRTR